jgi:2-dehydropantoate 2-reductase
MSDTTEAPAWPLVAVMGAGAVGCYFGAMLARAGAPVTLIGRSPHVEAIAAEGLLLDTQSFSGRVVMEASHDPAAASGAALVLLAVKTYDTEAAARALAPHLSPGAVVVSLQNGVDNSEKIRAAAGRDAFPAVVYVAAEMTAPGTVTHAGRGELIVGDPDPEGSGTPERERALKGIAAVFVRAGVPCRVSRNIGGELWTKLAINCAYNAVSALGRARYARLVSRPDRVRLLRAAVEETIAVGRVAGVRVDPASVTEAALRIALAMPDATSSTAQDLARGRRTEIEALNGFVTRRGETLGVPTPVNRTLATLVRLLEETDAPR